MFDVEKQFARLGVKMIQPRVGDPFDPYRHMHHNPAKTGVSYIVSDVKYEGYERRGQLLLEAVVDTINKGL
jgi:molecular chaperone GrpE (heat shock protein)